MTIAFAETHAKDAGARCAFGVFGRLLIEHVVSAPDSVGWFPFRLAYHEVGARVRDARAWVRKAVQDAMRLNQHHPLLGQARTRLDALGDDPDVNRAFLRGGRLSAGFQEARALMRLDRDLNDAQEPLPFTPADRDHVLARLGEIRGEAMAAGPVEVQAWEGLLERCRKHEDDLRAFWRHSWV